MDPAAVAQRRLNDNLWKILKALHEELMQARDAKAMEQEEEDNDNNGSQQMPTEAQCLQAELDLLMDHPSSSLSATSTPLSSSFAHADALLQKIVTNEPVSECEVEGFTESIVESFHELRELNGLLADSLERQAERLDHLQVFLKEQKEIYQGLRSMQKQRVAATARLATKPATSTPGKPKDDSAQQTVETQQLEQDLQYVLDSINQQQEQHEMASAGTSHQQRVNSTTTSEHSSTAFRDLILKLVKRRLESPDDPYLLFQEDESSSVDPRHIELLTRCMVAERYKNDASFLCLTDYRD